MPPNNTNCFLIICSNSDVYNGEGVRELCKRLTTGQISDLESCMSVLEKNADMIFTSKQQAHLSYSQELENLDNVLSGKKFFEIVFEESIQMIAALTPRSKKGVESMASYLLKQVRSFRTYGVAVQYIIFRQLTL